MVLVSSQQKAEARRTRRANTRALSDFRDLEKPLRIPDDLLEWQNQRPFLHVLGSRQARVKQGGGVMTPIVEEQVELAENHERKVHRGQRVSGMAQFVQIMVEEERVRFAGFVLRVGDSVLSEEM